MSSDVHPSRVRWVREGQPVAGARYVLYWLQINQRDRLNDALDFAIEQADALGLPVVVYQGVRPDYPGANDRLHTFLLEGAIDLAHALARKGIRYLFHLERRPAAAGGLLAALARDAALIVTDDFPVFIVPGQTRALARQIERPLAAVDASCVVPWSVFPKAEIAARTFRPKLHRALPLHLLPREDIAPDRPSADLDVPFPYPREGLESEERDWLDLAALGRAVVEDYAASTREPARGGSRERARRNAGAPTGSVPERGLPGLLASRQIAEWVASCAIDHRIGPSPVLRGGAGEARRRLDGFVTEHLSSYPENRNDPGREGATSGLSPYLHFGQISSLEVALSILASKRKATGVPTDQRALFTEGSMERARSDLSHHRGGVLEPVEPDHDGSRLAPAELRERLARALEARDSPEGAFLEQLLVRRELSFNFCAGNPQHASYEGLPRWARDTLDLHSLDPRTALYDRETLEWSETKDEVWNAAQTELRATGVIHNRMRMLWGKKILEWSNAPDEAVRTMIDLHDRYALDGRDPNTYANILWCLGLHDRPFGPERPVTGLIRPMSTEIARKKLDLDSYRARLATYEAK